MHLFVFFSVLEGPAKKSKLDKTPTKRKASVSPQKSHNNEEQGESSTKNSKPQTPQNELSSSNKGEKVLQLVQDEEVQNYNPSKKKYHPVKDCFWKGAYVFFHSYFIRI